MINQCTLRRDSPCGCPKSAKGGSDSEPSGGRLQPSRRAERDFCGKGGVAQRVRDSQRLLRAIRSKRRRRAKHQYLLTPHSSLFTLHSSLFTLTSPARALPALRCIIGQRQKSIAEASIVLSQVKTTTQCELPFFFIPWFLFVGFSPFSGIP